MAEESGVWTGTFECWQNRRFGEVYARFTKARRVFQGDLQLFVSHRPVIGNVTVYVYTPPADSSWVEDVFGLAGELGAVRMRVYSTTPVDQLARFLVEKPKTLVVDLRGGEAELWSAIGAKTRNMIRRAEKSAVSVREAGNSVDVLEWWKIYRRLATEAGFAAQSRELVVALLKERDLARLFLSEKDRRVIGGSLFLIDRYPMYWLGAVDRAYADCAPGHVNIWKALVHFACRGYPLMDLGGIDPNEEGSTRFKKSFSRDIRTAYLYQVPVGGVKQKLLAPFLK